MIVNNVKFGVVCKGLMGLLLMVLVQCALHGNLAA